ncbi:hypothetical protein L1047_08720 [Synechococcus sp. Nb3U1]|nr:hypothetical protein [Synechococcus sp. Nb3U1]
MRKNPLSNPSCVGLYRIPLAVVLLGITTGQNLVSPATALAQNENVNDAIRRDGNTNLFDGSSIDMNDLFRAADFLSNQNATSRWDSTAGVDAAVEQFNQSRRRPLQLSPGLLQPEPTATP